MYEEFIENPRANSIFSGKKVLFLTHSLKRKNDKKKSKQGNQLYGTISFYTIRLINKNIM